MKSSLILLSVLFAFSFNLAQDYFPLEVGNEWYYEERIKGPGSNIVKSNIIIISDEKVMPNGKEYFQLNSLTYNFIWKYVRIDSNKLFEYHESNNSENILFDFHQGKLDSTELFGEKEIIRKYGDVYNFHYFSKKYGLIEYGQGGTLAYNIFLITGCRISGITYGEKIDYSGYLPLAVGNRWFYETKFKPDGINEITDTIELKVISQKTMPNDLLYYEFSQNFPFTNYKYARVDSCKFFFYDEQQNQEILYMDFSTSYSPVSLEIAGKTYPGYVFTFNRDSPFRYFAKSIGLCMIGNFVNQYYKMIGFELTDSTSGYINISNNNPIITDYSLEQNYPNPFNPETNISVVLPKSGYARLTVYDMTGREISKLYQGELPYGKHNFIFDGTNLSSGIYFYRLESAGITQTKKMLLLK